MGPKWQSGSSASSLCMWENVGEAHSSLSHIVGPISPSRFDAVPGLVRSRQRFASLGHQPFCGTLPRRTE